LLLAGMRWRCRSRSPAGGDGLAISSRRRRYRSVDRALAAEVAIASPTRSAPAVRCAPRCRRQCLPRRSAAFELARLGAELDLGAATAEAVEAWRRRLRSERVDASARRCSSAPGGGDLAGCCGGSPPEPPSATGSPDAGRRPRSPLHRTAGVAMPSGGALFAE